VRIVVLYNYGTEAQVLTPEQHALIRRGVACLYEEAKEEAHRINLNLAALTPIERFRLACKQDDEIVAIEQLRAILYRSETYERTKEA
jgi:hypothetical protein